MKITYMGKEGRNRRGRFSRRKYAWMLLVMVAILGTIPFADSWLGRQIDVVQPAYAGETMTAKVDAELDKVINEIAQSESGNSKTDDALITIDDNKEGSLPKKDKVSLGCMQFKVSTVQRFWKQLRNDSLTNYDATMIALNCDKAKALAKEAIVKLQGSLWEWSVATQDMGARVGLIRELMN